MTKRIARRSDAPTGALTEREARSEERLRELAAWHMLHGMDEATARRRAQEEMDDDPARIEANTDQHFRSGFEEALAFFQTERLVLFSGIAFTSSLMSGFGSRFFCSNKLAGENGTNCASLLGSNSFEPRVAASNLII